MCHILIVAGHGPAINRLGIGKEELDADLPRFISALSTHENTQRD